LVTATSAGVGLALGKLSHDIEGGTVKDVARKHGDKIAIGLGVAASVTGVDGSIGDGLAGSGAALLGQKFGYKKFGGGGGSARGALPSMPQAPAGRPAKRR
jgi:hypothetical protein